MGDLLRLALGSLRLRPYVFGFVALYLLAATVGWGWRRALAFTGLAWAVAFVAEFASTRTGVPFGRYHYTGLTRGRELYLADVPFFDSLSFTFLAWASLGIARRLRARYAPRAGRLAVALAAGFLMMWLDLVIDPLAVRGDRWFLGPVFAYPEPGPYFGVPVANFIGWVVVGTVIAGAWEVLERRLPGPPPGWARRIPARDAHPVLLYGLVVVFNLAITGAIGEVALFWAGVAAHLPLAVLVVSSLASPVADAGGEAGERP